jgi:hypothetical protein
MAQQQHAMMMQQMQWTQSEEEKRIEEWHMQQQFEQFKLEDEAERWKN